MSQDARASQQGGVAQDPDKWLTTRTVSACGGHGPFLLGKSEAEGGVNCVDPETY
jgi:hypothetical protein